MLGRILHRPKGASRGTKRNAIYARRNRVYRFKRKRLDDSLAQVVPTRQRGRIKHVTQSVQLYRDYHSPVVGWRKFAPIPENCPFCESAIRLLGRRETHNERTTRLSVWVCEVCGWWYFTQWYEHELGEDYVVNGEGDWIHSGYGYAIGTLINMSPDDIRMPIEEVFRYLAAKNEALGYVSPKLVEEVVASAFKNIGYFVELTPYVGDEGIDVYLLNSHGNREVGVQVKRWNRRVSVDPIRSFLGALMIGGLTKGIMVSTGGYTKGANDAAEKVRDRGLACIDLKDRGWLVSTLKVGMRPCYSSIDDPDAPFQILLQEPARVKAWERWRQWD